MFNAKQSAVLFQVPALPAASEGQPGAAISSALPTPSQRPGLEHRGYRGSGMNVTSWALIVVALLLAPLSELLAEFFVEAADRLDRLMTGSHPGPAA